MSSLYTSKSPYYLSSVNQSYLDVMTLRQIQSVKDDVYYEVGTKYENRPDLLAYDIYGDSNLWWVFAVRNKDILKDPVYDLVAGIKIYVPKLSTLRSNLGI